MSKYSQVIPVILSGGSGTRLWPMSRKHYPKQFIPLRNERSLFQDTVARVKNLDNGVQGPIVVCNDEHRFMAAEQLRLEEVENADIVLEPVGRNTAPAIALAALQALQRNPHAILLVLPADHILDSQDQFASAVDVALQLCAEDYLVTFGIAPTRPETGYGYIKVGIGLVDNRANKVEWFYEKPELAKAKEYVAAGKYFWNSGMFMFRASAILNELVKYEDTMAADVKAAFESRSRDLDFIRIEKEAFAKCKGESIDYAVMEKTNNAAMVPLSSDWNDVGSWHALWESSAQDESSNATTGDVLLEDCDGCYVHSTNRLVTAVGMTDAVIVETADAVMVTMRGHSQKVKNIVNQLADQKRDEADIHRKVYRPWGSYESNRLFNF